MSSVVQLEHVGEPLVAAMFNTSVEVREALLGPHRATFHTATHEVPLKSWNGRIFDGTHRIDVAVRGSAVSSCLAVELKLGLSRMTATAFNKRFLEGTSPSHFAKRVKGSMVSVLERLSEESGDCPIYAELDGYQCSVEKNWVLVVRAKVAEQWSRKGKPELSDCCSLVVFEHIVEVYGGSARFNQAVSNLLDGDYYDEWLHAYHPPLPAP